MKPIDTRNGHRRVRNESAVVEEVRDGESIEEHDRVCNETAMASPPHGLRAHDHSASFSRVDDELSPRLGELRRRHVVGIAPEGRMLERHIGGAGRRPAPATEAWLPSIVDAPIR
jgi:hypothetical protein